MTTIVVIDKTKEIKEIKCKNLKKEDLYKKCNFRKNTNFDKRAEWSVDYKDDKYNIELYAKNEGQANSENKYDFPPPVDNNLYFGSCCLIRRDNDNNIISLSRKTWEKLYEILFGGFEDIKDETESEYESEEIEDKYKTKEGYLKDTFIIENSDDDSIVSEGLGDEEDESSNNSDIDNVNEIEIISYKNKVKNKIKKSNDEDSREKDNKENDNKLYDDYYDEYIGSELSEEEYDYDSE